MKSNKLFLLILMYVVMLLSSCEYKLEHQFQDIFKYDDTNHWVECVCGEKKDVTPHT